MQAARKIRQRHAVTPEGVDQGLRLVRVAIGHRDGQGRLGGKMRHAELDHFPRTDEEDVHLAEVFKEASCQPNSRGSHADGVGADLGLGAHLLGHGERPLKQLVECRPQRTRLVGHPHRILQLAEDLRLAQDHGVQATGHPKGVPRRIIPGEAVGVLLENGHLGVALLRQPAQGLGQLGVLTCAVDFGAVARGQDGHFLVRLKTTAQLLQRLLHALGGKGKPLPQRQGR